MKVISTQRLVDNDGRAAAIAYHNAQFNAIRKAILLRKPVKPKRVEGSTSFDSKWTVGGKQFNIVNLNSNPASLSDIRRKRLEAQAMRTPPSQLISNLNSTQPAGSGVSLPVKPSLVFFNFYVVIYDVANLTAA